MNKLKELWRNHSEPIVLFALSALILLCIVGCIAGAADERDCDRVGGKLVAGGPVYYVRTGNVMIPIQDQECVVEP